MIGSKEVNGKKTNTYSSRFSFNLGEEVTVTDDASCVEPKIIELYDDELLVKYFLIKPTTIIYHTVEKIIPYNKIQKYK